MSPDPRDVAPDDVVRAADLVVAALSPSVGRDWSVPAGRLEWSVCETVAHMAGAIAKYTLYLASRSTRSIAVQVRPWTDASRRERLDAIASVARAFAGVAAAAPPGTRAYHNRGMFDVSGYLATACVELLVHGHDVTEGLRLPYQPPQDLCRVVIARLFPWLSDTERPWETMLWHTGRVDLAGRPRNDGSWSAVATPLEEWDGTIPRRDPRAVGEWVQDPTAGRWVPRYLADM